MKELIFKLSLAITVGIAYLVVVPLVFGPPIRKNFSAMFLQVHGVTKASAVSASDSIIIMFMVCGGLAILWGILNVVADYRKHKRQQKRMSN